MKINEPIKVVFVGCGRIAEKHLKAIEEIGEKNIKITALVDKIYEKCQKFDPKGYYAHFQNINEALESVECDMGIIMTDSGAHYENALDFIKKGKNVLIEKPFTLKLTDANDLQFTAAEAGVNVFVVKQNRFNQAVVFAKDAVKRNLLGKLNIASIKVRWCRDQSYYDQATWRGTWSDDGGVITNQAIHHIDLLQWFMGPVIEVFAYSRTFGVTNIEVEDSVVAIVSFKSGSVATIEATTSVRPRNLEGSLSLIGNDGSIIIGGVAVNRIEKFEVRGENSRFFDGTGSVDYKDVYGEGHVSLYREILKFNYCNKNSAILLDEALKSLEIVHLIYKSIELKRPVKMSELGEGAKQLGYK